LKDNAPKTMRKAEEGVETKVDIYGPNFFGIGKKKKKLEGGEPQRIG